MIHEQIKQKWNFRGQVLYVSHIVQYKQFTTGLLLTSLNIFILKKLSNLRSCEETHC
jgi:hypothetical protein